MSRELKFYLALVLIGLALLLGRNVNAQDAADPTVRLREAIEHRPDGPAVDTALIITNLQNAAAKVLMTAYRANGTEVGREDLEVPGNGVAYIFVSDFLIDTDPRVFLGKVEALARGKVTGTAVLVGGPVTDLPSLVQYRREAVTPTSTRPVTQITFPVTATY